MINTGLDAVPENKLASLFDKKWSRSFLSSFAEIISAAFPLGQRMMGMDPRVCELAS
jgi:hypothetical protein